MKTTDALIENLHGIIDTLRARLTLTEQALEAAGELMSVMEVPHYTKDEITLLCDFCDKPLNSHASYCTLGQREQAYIAAVARLEEVTK